MTLTLFVSRYGKFAAAIVGAVTEAINLGIVPSSAQHYVTVIVTILTALGVYAVPNGPTAAQSAVEADVTGIKQALGPHFLNGGVAGVEQGLADLVANHVDAIERTVADGKAEIEALIHPQAAPVATFSTAPQTVGAPVATVPVDAATASGGNITPVAAEPVSPVEPAPADPIAILAALAAS